MPTVALITCRRLPEADPDEALLLEALRAAHLEPRMMAWDDPDARPATADLCVLRSCWNSYENPRRFQEWIETTSALTTLLNPAHIVRWNQHKSYLAELERAGLAVVPTVWCLAGEPTDLARTMAHQDWPEVVIKPSVSAGSYKTRRFAREQRTAGQRFLDEVLAERDAMIQPMVLSTTGPGERALVWIDGELTHAVTKEPRFSDGEESVSAASPLSVAERDFANRTLACIGKLADQLLYARIDVMSDETGRPMLSELELIEPSLFLAQCPAALERLVAAMVRRLPDAPHPVHS